MLQEHVHLLGELGEWRDVAGVDARQALTFGIQKFGQALVSQVLEVPSHDRVGLDGQGLQFLCGSTEFFAMGPQFESQFALLEQILCLLAVARW